MFQVLEFSILCNGCYWHSCVQLFHFSVSWYSEMQFCVIYLETLGSTQPYVAFLTPGICSCFFVFGGTRKALNFLHCTIQCLLCKVILVDSCMELVFHVLCQNAWWFKCLLMWDGSVYHNPLGPPVNLFTTGTVGWQFVLSVHYAKFVSLTSSVSLSLWAEMSSSSDECAS